MRILLPTPQNDDFLEALNQVESWDFVVAPYNLPGKDSCLKQDFWLGSSHNGKTWILSVVPFDDYEDFNPAESAIAALLDPPKQNEDTIAEILFRIYIEGETVDRLSAAAIDAILADVQFPEYLPVESYLPDAPKDWQQLPSELVVGFTLSEGACVGGGTFNEYSRDSLEDVLRVVCGPRQDGILIAYTLAAREVIPLLKWDVDWPLSRRGTAAPERREKVQGMLPWETEADQSLLSIYQHVSGTGFWGAPPYFSKPVVRLRVGGRSQEEAISNWYQCARALRRLKKDTPVFDPLWERGETNHE
jgi:hypothetical protein